MTRRKKAAAEVTAPESATAALAGEWNIYRAAELRAQLLALVEGGAREFDLAGVTEIDSAGLQLLAALRASVAGAGGSARFLEAAPCVREALQLCGLEGWLAQAA
jgi:anti-anti-sigma factor